jgi:DNA polymerase-3 subunit alpha
VNAVDLHVHSTFSTYDGMGSPKAVVARAVELGWGAVALTEHGNICSAPSLYQEARKAKIKPIIGCEMYVTPDEDLRDGDKDVLKERRHLTVLALSFEGYQNLVTWVNAAMQRPLYYNGPRISLDRMVEMAPWPLHHNAILSGCMGGELCQCLMHGNGNAEYAASAYINACKSIFPNFYIELQNHSHDKFMERGLTNYEQMVAGQAAVRDSLLQLASTLDVPVIVTNDSHYQKQEQRKAHLAMLARKQWRRGRDAHEGATTDSQASGFYAEYVYWTNYMRSIEKVASSLPKWAEEQGIESIHEIVAEADIRLDPLDKFSYTIPRSGYSDPVAEVRKRAKARLKMMVIRHGKEAADRFEYELNAMAEFADYLCLVSDVVRMARDSGIYTWTRGSAANSLVCFCLKIHDIDPIHYKLMFERFVNPARTKLPDIDIDFEGHRRDDVARMVTEHMAAIEGEGNVRGICTFNTVNNRAAFRMMAESAGVAQERIDELAKILPQMIDSGLVTDEEEAYELLKDEFPDLYELVENVFDAVAGVSQHACAYVVGTEERPLDQWVPNYRIGSSDTLVTQYNMEAIEDLGFLKLDLLKLDTLSIMHNVARMLGKDIKWLDSIGQPEVGIYELDDKTLTLLREGRTEGVHSFQGATQRRGCMEVLPETIEDMIAIQALYRPSGTRTGLDKSFVNRRHGREQWEPINEIHGEFVNETYGIAIYQEQIMAMGGRMGMSGEEIDDLYKAIKTAKGAGRGAKELFEGFEATFRKYADKLMPEDEADELWAEWDKLQGYTFNRGHASSYGILGAAKCAYLAAHHPQEFLTALLDRYPDNPRYLAAVIANGYRFEAPDVNASGGSFAKGSDDKSIRIGLARIKSVGPGAVSEIVRNQPFASVEDLKERTSGQRVKQPTIEALGAVGALASLGIQGEEDDLTDFDLMQFIPRKPKVFKGIKPQYRKNRGGSWEFKGLERGVVVSQGKTFCAKLFWIPPLPPDDKGKSRIFTTKTSATGKVNAHLLTVVDENGIPFDLIVPDIERKESECNLVKLLARKAQDAVICAEGQVAMPFLRGGNPGFKLWGIAGAEDGNPNLWRVDENIAKMVIHLAETKRKVRA